jgi:NTE family protein
MNTRTSEVYSRDTTPNMSVAEAVRRFMSIPLFFPAVREPDEVFVDGGLLDNYPVRLFDRAKYVAEQNRPRHTTITKAYAEAKREKIENFFVYGWKLIQTLMRSQDNRHLESGDWHRTVYINTLGVDKTEFEFDLDHETKLDLEASGRAGTEQYFDWYDANAPRKRPLKRPPD